MTERTLFKISLIMFSLKRKGLETKIYVKSVINQIPKIIGAEHAMPVISERTLANVHQMIKRLTTLFKILKFIYFIRNWYRNGIRGKKFSEVEEMAQENIQFD